MFLTLKAKRLTTMFLKDIYLIIFFSSLNFLIMSVFFIQWQLLFNFIFSIKTITLIKKHHITLW